jgi:hypothetical protein
MMIDYKSLAERIRQTLAEGGNCELNTEEWRAVADLLERQEKSRNVYVVTANGWREGYGANIYLMGVFTSRKKAQEAAHELPYSTQINGVPIDKAFPLKRDYDNCLEDDNYSNQYYLGGYCE